MRTWQLEDAENERAARAEEARLVRYEQREHDALAEILLAFGRIPSLGSDGRRTVPDLDNHLLEFACLLGNTIVRVLDSELRDRLRIMICAIDAVVEDDLPEFAPYEVLLILRSVLRNSIGARLRGEAMPAATQDWTSLTVASMKWQERRKSALARDGYNHDTSTDVIRSRLIGA